MKFLSPAVLILAGSVVVASALGTENANAAMNRQSESEDGLTMTTISDPAKLPLAQLMTRESHEVSEGSDRSAVPTIHLEKRGTSFKRLSHAKKKRYHLIHACLASVSFVGLFPLGGLLIRFASFRGVLWVHAACQFIAYAFYLPAFGLGLWFTSYQPSKQRADKHAILGIIVFALLFLQPFLGWMHHAYFKKEGRRSWWSHLHTNVGRIAIVLGIINGAFGLVWTKATRESIVAYSVVASIAGVAYLGCAIYGEIRIYQRRPRTEEKDTIIETQPSKWN